LAGRLQSGGNAENLDDTSRVVKHTPLSSDPANLPVPTTSPIPNPTVRSKSYLNSLEELCGQGNVYLYLFHSALSGMANMVFLIMIDKYPSYSKKSFNDFSYWQYSG
jgi:hypothetical protein